MKILFSGYHNPHFLTITEYIERAIESLGHELFVFDDRQHIIPGRIRKRVTWLHEFDVRRINRRLVSLALKTKPDAAIVTGGHRITGETVKALKENGCLTVLWTIDPPLDFRPIIEVAPLYDYIFCQGTEAIELLDHAGIKGAHWLPVACDPKLHRPVELSVEEEKLYGNNLVFVGSYYPNRSEMFEELIDFDLGIWGPGWEKVSSDSPLKWFLRGGQLEPEAWIKIYSASKIVLAPHYRHPENRFPIYQASPRIFEALACGAFVISDNEKDAFSLFNDSEHLARFDSVHDLIEKARYYLDHPVEREQIAWQGRQEVLNNHTYVDRIESLLSLLSKG